MSFEGLLDDLCDIYTLKVKTKGGSYGLPDKEIQYYSDTPDFINVRCHFNKIRVDNPIQSEPQNKILYPRKLNFPINIDIKSMDKIVNKIDGIAYYAGIPGNIRNHHIIVPVRKVEEYL